MVSNMDPDLKQSLKESHVDTWKTPEYIELINIGVKRGRSERKRKPRT